jgi:hypothetical protein
MFRVLILVAMIFLIPGASHAGVVYGFIFDNEGFTVNGKVRIECPETAVEGWLEEGYFELLIPEDEVECWIYLESAKGQIYSFAQPTNYDFILYDGELLPDN